MIKTYIAVIMSHTDITLTEDDIPVSQEIVQHVRWAIQFLCAQNLLNSFEVCF